MTMHILLVATVEFWNPDSVLLTIAFLWSTGPSHGDNYFYFVYVTYELHM